VQIRIEPRTPFYIFTRSPAGIQIANPAQALETTYVRRRTWE